MKTIASILTLALVLGVGIQSASTQEKASYSNRISAAAATKLVEIVPPTCEEENADLKRSFENLQDHADHLECKLQCYERYSPSRVEIAMCIYDCDLKQIARGISRLSDDSTDYNAELTAISNGLKH